MQVVHMLAEMPPVNSPQYFGGNWALAMHGCIGHSLVQH